MKRETIIRKADKRVQLRRAWWKHEEKLREMFSAGATTKEVAKKLGVTPKAVAKWRYEIKKPEYQRDIGEEVLNRRKEMRNELARKKRRKAREGRARKAQKEREEMEVDSHVNGGIGPHIREVPFEIRKSIREFINYYSEAATDERSEQLRCAAIYAVLSCGYGYTIGDAYKAIGKDACDGLERAREMIKQGDRSMLDRALITARSNEDLMKYARVKK